MHKIDEIQCSLEKTSLDDRDNVTKEYMTHSQLRVCAFDDVKKWYVREKIPFANPNPKSNDALYFEEDECFFIEFKNGRITDQVNFEINKKIYDSLFILFDLKYTDKKGKVVDAISYTREKMTYILVYNEQNYLEYGPTKQTKLGEDRQRVSQSHHRDLLYKSMRKLAQEEFILFGLDQFQNYLFKHVYTFTEKEFEQNFVNKRKENNI